MKESVPLIGCPFYISQMASEAIDILLSLFTVLSLLANLLLVLCFSYVPSLREDRGQLIFAHCISQFLFDLHWLTVFVPRPSWECEALGFFGVLGYVCTYNYAGAIITCIWDKRCDGKISRLWLYHGMAIGLAGIAALLVTATGCAGGSVMGTCYIEEGSNAE